MHTRDDISNQNPIFCDSAVPKDVPYGPKHVALLAIYVQYVILLFVCVFGVCDW